ncbi:hypothetical protein SLS62_005811 [Diatrype stigma]|uniref:DUF6604 domain-containing protein n=1 Tax=Diatrype stigma TaxID=117547 RepID=A0AAN9UUA7_9PEZI
MARYKKETGIVTSWMVSSGREVRCHENLVAPGNNGGKKRNLATSNFEPLAAHLASSTKPSVTVPLSVMAALDGAIYIRRIFSNKLIQQREVEQTTPEEKQSDESHDHFTKVLEAVRRILTPIAETRMLSAGGSQRDNSLANAFAKLRVGGLSSPDAAVAMSLDEYMDTEPDYSNLSNRLSDDVVPEGHDSLEELGLLFKALLQDYSKLRTKVQEIWGRYSSGQLNLASAAVAVDMAIRLARQLEEHHREVFMSYACNIDQTSVEAWKTLARQLGTSNKAIKRIPASNIYFLLFYNQRQGLKPEHISNAARILAEGHTIEYDESKRPFMGVFATLSMLHFQVVSKRLAKSPEQILRARKDQFGECDIRKDTQNLSKAERSKYSHALLLEAIIESTLLEGSELPMDEFSRAATQLVKEERLDLWMVFAAQAYVDGCSALGRDIGRPLDQLQGFTEKSLDEAGIQLLREMLRSADLSRARWGSIQDTQLRETNEFLQALLDDPIAARKRATKGGVQSDEPFFLMRRQPLLCGLLLLISRCRMEEAGVLAESRIKGIFAMANLYSVCKHEGYLKDGQWVELERIIATQGSSAFFLDPSPQDDHRTYSRYYRRAAGAPAPHIRPDITSQPVKVVKQLGTLSWKLYYRFYHPQHRGPVTMTDGDLKKLAKEIRSSSPPSSSTTNPSSSSENQPQRKGPPELVQTLATALDREQTLMSCLYARVFIQATLVINEVEMRMAERRGGEVANNWDPVKVVDAVLANVPANLELAAGVLGEEMERYRVSEAGF